MHTLAYRSTDVAGNVEVEKTATVRIDMTAPVTSDDAPAGWSNSAVTVTLSASDAGGSGLAGTEYRLDAAATWSSGTNVTVAGDGVHTLRYRSSDVAGNTEPDKTATVRIDTTAPVTSDNAPTGWANTAVTVTLTATDTGGSGVAKTEYSVDGAAAWTTGASVSVPAPADHSNDGLHTVSYRSTDSLGHVEATKTATVRIDTTAPVTSDDAPTGWSNGPVTVALSATDVGAGVAATEYKLDGAASWSSGTGVAVSAEGVHTLVYRSTDAAGNVETEKTATVRIDTSAPVTSDDAASGWSSGPVLVALTATDGGSGVTRTEYKLDGAASFTVGTVAAIAAPSDHSNDGVHTIVYRSTDEAGNTEAERTATVRIDTTAPVTSDDAPAGWSNGPVTVSLSATDAGSGVAATEYRVDGAAAWTTGTTVTIAAPADHSNDDVHTITYRSTDSLGHVEAAQTATVRIDTQAPATTDDAPTGWKADSVTVTLTASDTGGSGLAATQYKVDGAASFSTGTSVPIAAPADHSNDGVHTITYRSIDAAGNVGTIRTATVRIDTQAPSTTDNAPAGWSASAVTVTLTAADAHSGVATTEYRLDGATAWTTGTSVTIPAPADHSNDGPHTITYRSTDAVGNVEAEKTATVRIDTQAPVTTDNAPAGWSASAVTVTLTAADTRSGVATTEYRLDGATAWTSGASVTIPAPADHSNDGPHTITYRSTDAVGNVEAEKTATVQIDTLAPVTFDNAPSGWRNSPVTVMLIPFDVGSGVATTEYKVDGATAWTIGTSITVPAPADHSNDGPHTITYRSTDAVGNLEESHTTTVRIDTQTPVTTDDAPVDPSASEVTVTLTAADLGGSGIATTEYMVDGGVVWTAGTSITIPAPADHSNDGLHTITYRSTDAAGNVEATRTVTVRIDTSTLP